LLDAVARKAFDWAATRPLSASSASKPELALQYRELTAQRQDLDVLVAAARTISLET
jgi:hypothetical protein